MCTVSFTCIENTGDTLSPPPPQFVFIFLYTELEEEFGFLKKIRSEIFFFFCPPKKKKKIILSRLQLTHFAHLRTFCTVNLVEVYKKKCLSPQGGVQLF